MAPPPFVTEPSRLDGCAGERLDQQGGYNDYLRQGEARPVLRSGRGAVALVTINSRPAQVARAFGWRFWKAGRIGKCRTLAATGFHFFRTAWA